MSRHKFITYKTTLAPMDDSEWGDLVDHIYTLCPSRPLVGMSGNDNDFYIHFYTNKTRASRLLQKVSDSTGYEFTVSLEEDISHDSVLPW